MKCPLCRSESFYFKNPQDEYETWEFECKDGKICFDPQVDTSQIPPIEATTETFCQRCSWHGAYGMLGKSL